MRSIVVGMVILLRMSLKMMCSGYTLIPVSIDNSEGVG